jgi:predicted adenine nucleotide alpha hydrolase (AANH) superfamily ATPase
VAEELKKNHEVTLFFYNPNIFPQEEYDKRLNEVRKWAEKNDFELIEGPYVHLDWLQKILGYEKEKEGGLRCPICFSHRLEITAQLAKQNGYDIFATTLSISPHKNAETINRLGKEIAEKYQLNFYEADWKKNDGYRHSCQLAKAEGFYRQDYCGCEYSRESQFANRLS